MSEEQDAAVVDRVLAGDVQAFASIVRRWQGPLVTLAFRFCRDRDQAEEMAQGGNEKNNQRGYERRQKAN